MRWHLSVLALCGLLTASTPAGGQHPAPKPDGPLTAPEGEQPATLDRGGAVEVPICEPPATCVPEKDMEVFVKLLREKKCLLGEEPTFELDPINIVVDRQGRVFYSGAEPHPYTVKMTWCDYEVEAKGKVDIVAAMREPPIWGFRFRPKAYIGALPGEAFYSIPDGESLEVIDLVDAGAMVDFLYYDWANLNVAVGFRSVGGGIGFDLTENFGAYGGYALTWGDWHHNANIGLWFSFYNPD